MELRYRFARAPLGSDAWLIKTELAYGGLVTDVARQKVSPLDRRTADELAIGGMTGGDRMLHHGYAQAYARFLQPFVGKDGLTVAEFGILKGTGLAIWCDLFRNSRVLGFDIDLGHFRANEMRLRRLGAFQQSPEVHEYDQLVDGSAGLANVLEGRKLDVVIDDGLHSLDSILTTWRSVRPHLSDRFVYFIEDYPELLQRCGSEFTGFDCHAEGMMTVVTAGVIPTSRD